MSYRTTGLCPDCNVKPGENHEPGCDIEQCANCGRQAIGCGCEESEYGALKPLPWTGEWPGDSDCRMLGFWCIWTNTGWKSCDRETPGATEDLNRLATCRWNRATRQFEKS